MEHDDVQLSQFFESISSWEHLYERRVLSFIGVKSEGVYLLVQAKVIALRDWAGIPDPYGIYKTDQVIAGQVSLDKLGMSLRQLADAFMSGRLTVEGEKLIFPTEENGRVSASFIKYQRDAASSGRRVSALILGGKQQHGFVNKIDLDWHLRGQAVPFESLDELWGTVGVGSLDLGFANVEFMAGHVAEVHLGARVDGTAAFPGILVPRDTDKENFCVGYRVFATDKFVTRGTIAGRDLLWKREHDYWIGSKEVSVPSGAAVQCFASYLGHAHYQGWIGDPTVSPNLMRLVYEDLDTNLEVIKDLLFEEGKARKDSRDFEQGVAWLFWLLGFSVVHPGHKRLEDNVDLIAATRSGNLMVIECTTGLLSKEGKLQNLLHRVASLKKRLAKAGLSSKEVLAVGVSSKQKDEIIGDMAEATKLGVLALSIEDLRNGLDQSYTPVDADQYFVRAMDELRRRASQNSGFGRY